MSNCDAKTRKIVETDLLPEQPSTHRLCRTLKEFVATPS